MAVLLGTSGAWATIEASLRSRHLEATHPRDLTFLLQQAKLRQQSGIEPLYLDFDRELEETGRQIDQLHQQFAQNASILTQHFTEEIRQAERKLSAYRSHLWLLQWTTLLFPKLKTLRRKKMLLEQKDLVAQELRDDLKQRRLEYAHKRQQRDEVVRRCFQQIADNITFLEKILSSPELAGGNAELEVIDCLRALPDTYYVCSDVNLRATRKIRFQGEYLQTAQIDHLVVGSGGIFVLEVKRWSRQFIERGNFFDPYKQVARSSYLCYDLLRGHMPGVRVRSVLVNCGELPPRRDDFHIKVVTLPELHGYLAWFRKPVLNKEQIARIIEILRV